MYLQIWKTIQWRQQRLEKKRKPTLFSPPLPDSVNHETSEEDDEEMVGVPEDFEVAASDDLHGGGDDEDEGQRDDDPRDASDAGEEKVCRGLLRILRHEKRRTQKNRRREDGETVLENKEHTILQLIWTHEKKKLRHAGIWYLCMHFISLQ